MISKEKFTSPSTVSHTEKQQQKNIFVFLGKDLIQWEGSALGEIVKQFFTSDCTKKELGREALQILI